MTAYLQRVGELTDLTEQRVLGLWERQTSGAISRDQFVAAAAAQVAAGNARATSLADVALAVAIADQLGAPLSPLGLLPDPTHVDQPRLRDAVRAVLAADIATATTREELAASQAARLARIARDEVPGTASAAMTAAMRERGVPGWTRVLSADACPLCEGWADGTVRPPTVEMARHTACACVQQPVVR